MRKMILLLFALTTMVFAQDLGVQVTSPGKNAEFKACSSIELKADVTHPEGVTIRRVVFYANGAIIRAVMREPFETVWENVPDGIYEISAIVMDSNRNEAESEPFYIFVGSVEPGDVIINGQFNCEIDPWSLETYEGGEATIEMIPDLYLTEDPSGVIVEIQDAGNQTWSVQLMQPFEAKEGHTYTVTFWAMADEPKTVTIDVSKNYDDYAPKHSQAFEVYDLNLYGPFEFTATEDDDNMMFKFILSGNTIPVYLDGIKVIDSEWTRVEERAPEQAVNSFELLQNYPNPFNPTTRIQYRLDKARQIELTIFDILGKEVYSISEFSQAGAHSVEWNGMAADGSPSPSGIYFYQLKTEFGSLTKKMHLIR